MHALDVLLVLSVCATILMLYTGIMHLFVLRVPYIPTSNEVVQSMLDLACVSNKDHVYDLGAGDGRILIAAKRRCPKIVATGCEAVFTIWMLGKMRTLLSGHHISFRWMNVFSMNVRQADVVFLYVGPGLMGQLENKFDQELKPGTRVISNAFTFPGRKPKREVSVRGGTIFLYVW